MRRFREVEKHIDDERLTNNDEYDFDKRIGEEGFMKIKPKTNMTYEEAKSFWDEIFDKRI